MDQQQRGRRHFNNGGQGRGYYNNNNNGNNNHYQHHSRGEFHASASTSRAGGLNTNNNIGQDNNPYMSATRPTYTGWRSLMKRQTELFTEKIRTMRDIDGREFEALHKLKEDTAAGGPELEKGKKSETAAGSEDAQKELSSSSSSSKTKKLKEKSSFDVERTTMTNKFAQRERKLDMDTQRFFQDIERFLQTMERRAIFEPRFVETELGMRDQQIVHCHQRIAILEEKNRNIIGELDYYREMAQQLSMQKVQMEQDFMVDKEAAMMKARAEAMAQFVRMNSKTHGWKDPFVASDPKLNLDPSPDVTHHPLLSSASFHAWVSDSQSPCLQPMPSFTGSGVLSDLRDRYEDVKCTGFMENNDRTEWMLHMIRKVVLYYEDQSMRVYEETLPNQFVSTLIWCPNETLCPQKSEGAFALGYGLTPLEATENTLIQAYNTIMESDKDSSGESSTLESGSECESSETSSARSQQVKKISSSLEAPPVGLEEEENNGIDDVIKQTCPNSSSIEQNSDVDTTDTKGDDTGPTGEDV